jgi:hypothetical protein
MMHQPFDPHSTPPRDPPPMIAEAAVILTDPRALPVLATLEAL